MRIAAVMLSAAAACTAATLSAEPVLYYQFAPGANQFKSQVNSPALDASENPQAKVEIVPDVPGKTIVSGDKVVNADNTGSLKVTVPHGAGVLAVPPAAKLATPGFTVEFFLKADKTSPWAGILDLARDSSDNHSWMFQRGSDTPNARIRLDLGTAADMSGHNWCREGEAAVFDGKWHHLAMTFDDASKTARFYVDYDLQAEGVAPRGIQFGENLLRILPQVPGQIDEIRVSNTVLEPEDMLRVK